MNTNRTSDVASQGEGKNGGALPTSVHLLRLVVGGASICIFAALASTASTACITTSSCDSFCDGGESGGGAVGDSIECCFVVNFEESAAVLGDGVEPGQTAYFCAGPPNECFNHAESHDADDLAMMCDGKDPVGNVVLPNGHLFNIFTGDNIDGMLATQANLVTSFSAVGSAGPTDFQCKRLDSNVCAPFDVQPFPMMYIEPPGYTAFFSDRDGSLDLDVAGYTIGAEYYLQIGFALTNCESGGVDGGTCDLEISSFDVAIHNVTMSEGELDYQVDATLQLVRPAVASVTFDECVGGVCSGEFEFSVAEGNPIDFGLVWTQVDLNYPYSTSVAALLLSNAGDALGGVEAVYGTIAMDPLAQSGSLLMDGYGEDSWGGEFASATFGVFGFVEAMSEDVGNCCETHSPSGCSAEYVKACVCVADPACCSQSYGAEWNSACVAAVETYNCGVCS